MNLAANEEYNHPTLLNNDDIFYQFNRMDSKSITTYELVSTLTTYAKIITTSLAWKIGFPKQAVSHTLIDDKNLFV